MAQAERRLKGCRRIWETNLERLDALLDVLKSAKPREGGTVR